MLITLMKYQQMFSYNFNISLSFETIARSIRLTANSVDKTMVVRIAVTFTPKT
jgi:hypothetical protein